MRIVILTSFNPHSIYVVNRLVKEGNVVGRVVEDRGLLNMDRKEKLAQWSKIKKKYGLLKTLNRYLFMKYYLKFVSKKEESEKISLLFPDGERASYQDRVPTINVGNINDDEAARFIKEHEPDVICVCGTSILKPRIFSLAKYGAINIHVGITPEYRSAKPIEWALYNRDYDNIGVTVHFVDEGVDTGDIIYQTKVPLQKGDNVGRIYARCKIEGCNLMLKAISDIEKRTIKKWQKEGVPGRKYISH